MRLPYSQKQITRNQSRVAAPPRGCDTYYYRVKCYKETNDERSLEHEVEKLLKLDKESYKRMIKAIEDIYIYIKRCQNKKMKWWSDL